jgi:hypothetical protein
MAPVELIDMYVDFPVLAASTVIRDSVSMEPYGKACLKDCDITEFS